MLGYKNMISYLLLLCDFDILFEKFRSNDVIDVVDSSADTLAMVLALDVVAKFQGLMDTGRSTRGNSGTEQTKLCYLLDIINN